MKKILVPYDGSELACSVFPHVEILAKGLKAKVILLHILPMPTGRSGAAFRPESIEVPISLPETPADAAIALHPIYKNQEMASAEAKAREEIKPIESDFKEAGLQVETEVLFGKAAEEILNYAEREEVDLIIMCSHGSGGFGRWLLGSTAEKVMRGTDRPVMLIRPPGFKERYGLGLASELKI